MRFRIRGTVQGVGFRPTVFRIGESMGLNGRVFNNGADVVVETDGGSEFIRRILDELPALAKVEEVIEDPCEYKARRMGFFIDASSPGGPGVGIPTDTAICPECLSEIRSPGRRHGYAFTTCTECGARFTLMDAMPYDRDRTSMRDFPKCPECGTEYDDPRNRRFHHQTVCCPHCGPKYCLLDSKGKELNGDPIRGFAKRIDSGCIGIAKSWGGMHICSTLDNTAKLRKWYGREQKPFAIMVRDIDAVRRYSDPTDEELAQMTSPHRPIVLVRKTGDLPEEISPGLDTVGMFLPYTGMQYLLFDTLDHDALIMTSANVPGEPMILSDDDVMELGADVYLLHNQRIANRADDSVVKLFGDRTYFIRKSRGHIPSYIDFPLKGEAVALGAQENLTASVAINGRIHTTQHIGNGESVGVVDYLESAVDSMINMTGCEPSAVAIDIHPGYSNRKYAKTLSERFDAQIVDVQHHWAHCASLMVDNGVTDRMSFLSLDGTGHGTDGNAWGGEVLSADLKSFERVAHLQYIPLIGGDKALYDIRRLCYGIDRINGVVPDYVDDRTSSVFDKMIPNSILTSSMGRLLDALAFRLGFCTKRTYDGEPAMKMESVLARGKRIEGFETEVMNGEIMICNLFSRIDDGQKKEDVAFSIVDSVMSRLVESACDAASSIGAKNIGLTGGVSYCLPISRMFASKTEALGYIPVTHCRVPNGDGGISVGQAAIALERLE